MTEILFGSFYHPKKLMLKMVLFTGLFFKQSSLIIYTMYFKTMFQRIKYCYNNYFIIKDYKTITNYF